jgi:hypothetical protein
MHVQENRIHRRMVQPDMIDLKLPLEKYVMLGRDLEYVFL